MGISFEIDVDEGLVYIASEGQILPAEWPEFVNKIRTDPNFENGLDLIIDRRTENVRRPDRFH